MEIAKLLVKHGANASLVNGFGNTPSQQAFQRKHPELADWLTQAAVEEEASRPPVEHAMPTWGAPKEDAAKEEL